MYYKGILFLSNIYFHFINFIVCLGSMQLVPDAGLEPDLALRHVLRVLEAVEPRGSEVCAAACYVTDPARARPVQEYWRTRYQCKLDIILVSQLPRAANYEWEIVAEVPSPDE